MEDISIGWTRETAHPSYQNKWSDSNRSAGQCAITAMYLNQKYGYPIFETTVGKSRHFFNKDNDGKVIDLTKYQFNVDIDYSNSRQREFKDLYKSCGSRYELFVSNLKKNLKEAYLDDEHKFYDFRTQDISNGEYIDTTTTGVPHYNSILSAMKNGGSYENLTGEIVYMSPEEYYKECATKIFTRSTVDSLKMSRGEADREIIEHLKQVILRFGKRFPLPFLNYAAKSQEGLHRMLALAELTSWDRKFPVLLVRYADEELARREEKQQEINNIIHKIRMAARDALMYKFYNYEEFKEQLQWSIDKEWQFSDSGTPKYDVLDLNDCFRIAIGEAYYDVDKEDIKIVAQEPNDDLDDVELDDIEDFLIRHFGDDWRKTFPNLKDKFNIKENLSEDLNSIVQDVSSYVDKYDSDGSNQNCLFSTWAVELQLRGENFLPRPVYSPRDPIFNIKGEDIVINPKRIKIKSKEDVHNQVLAAGEGARFYCHVNWEGSNGGHEFLIINDNNTVLIVDGQSGYVTEIDKDKEYFEDVNFKNSYLVRLDNKEINQDILRYNDEDQIVEWDDAFDLQLLNEDLSSNNEFLDSIIDELSEFDYAFIDADGEELDDEDAMKAVVQSPDQLEDLGKGVCTDFVEYTCKKLDERKISHKVYDIACTDKDGDHPAHVFVVVENEGKFLWLEAAWHSEAGIHEYDSLEELFEDIARKHCIYDGENYLDSCEIREIKKSLVGMSQEAIYDYVDTLPIVWKTTNNISEKLSPKISRRDNPNDYSPFGYKVDFYDGDAHIGEGSVCGINDDSAFLYDFEVYPEFRGKGYSKEMLQFMIDEYDLKQLYVHKDNNIAINLYKKYGFEVDDEIEDNGVPSYSMIRESFSTLLSKRIN